jgi:hypothetical protein
MDNVRHRENCTGGLRGGPRTGAEEVVYSNSSLGVTATSNNSVTATIVHRVYTVFFRIPCVPKWCCRTAILCMLNGTMREARHERKIRDLPCNSVLDVRVC